MEVISKALMAVAVNYGVHFMSARFYDAFCVPHTLQEIAQTLVTTASPICTTAINVAHMTQSNYASVITITLAGGIVNLLKA
jgi:hypothetical protein